MTDERIYTLTVNLIKGHKTIDPGSAENAIKWYAAQIIDIYDRKHGMDVGYNSGQHTIVFTFHGQHDYECKSIQLP